MAQPKQAQVALFDELNRLANDPSRTEFEIASFRRKVERLKLSDIFHYRILLGALAAQQGDIEESRTQHELAVQQVYSAESLSNFALSMQKLGLFADAVALVRKARDLEPEVISHWKGLVTSQLLSGDFQGAGQTLDALLAKAPKAFDGDGFADVVWGAAEIAEARGLTAESLTPIPTLAIRCAHQHGIKRFTTRLAKSEDEDTNWISLVIGVVGVPSSKIVKANESFVEALIDSDISSSALTAFSIRFAPEDGVSAS